MSIARVSLLQRVAVSLLVGLLAFPQPSHVAERRTMAEAAGSGVAPGLDDTNTVTVELPAIAVAPEKSNAQLSDPVAAPSLTASAAGMATEISTGVWHVPQHLPLQSFLFSTGPQEIVRYNFNLVKREQRQDLVRRQPSQPGGGYNAADTLVFQPIGQIQHARGASAICWREEWACSGASAYNKAPPNCQRACGGIGMCEADCTAGSRRHHNCTFRVIISASLEDVSHNRRRVEIKGAPRPPPLGLPWRSRSPFSLVLPQVATCRPA